MFWLTGFLIFYQIRCEIRQASFNFKFNGLTDCSLDFAQSSISKFLQIQI